MMMEPAIKQKFVGTVPSERMEKMKGAPADRQIQDWETKVGKIIFYLTCATALWFSYWFNGIQCPC
jgi:hypothetical protein